MPNRLAGETSPYLLQHAGNPVDWWPWCAEALAAARRDDRPILLSIGYSACHWCHVMARESFENAAVAALMNAHFVNIKVDREERPDLDRIYQTAHQMLMRRSGGWPLTMFLSPDGTPFYGGTYFPARARYGMPAFPDLLRRVAETFSRQREAIARQDVGVRNALTAYYAPEQALAVLPPGEALAGRLAEDLSGRFDAADGGFGGAPKFPHCSDLAFLWRRHRVHDDARAGHIVLHTLRHMIGGGVYDQLGGGFYRYSTDDHWEIPHFEKMLYDNGLLLGLCAEAWAATGAPEYARAVEGTAGWLLAEMRTPEGGFCSTLDADSEHQEGRYYVWRREEAEAHVGPADWPVARLHWGFDGAPNFVGETWHLQVARPLDEVAAQLGIAPETAAAALDRARTALLAQRAERERPARDDKVLTGWNALAIEGLARAGRLFGRPGWIDAACAAADFIRAQLWRDGRLLATFRQGRARLNAYLDDHAYLLAALLELLQARFRPEDLAFAETLADALLDAFQDRAAGGFFFTRDDHEALLLRPRSGQDDATPSGNGVAAGALLRLGHLLGRPELIAAAEATVRAFGPALLHDPRGYASLLQALEESRHPPALVVVSPPPDDAAWRRACRVLARPDRLILMPPAGVAGLPAVLARPAGTPARAWVCHGTACLPPCETPEGLAAVLASAA